MYKVYCIENTINHKKYVGVTKQSMQSRMRKGKGYVKHPYFYLNIQKYGWQNFQVSILFNSNDRIKAFDMEEYFIKKFNLINKNYGYNERLGGLKNKPTKEIVIKIHNNRTNLTPVAQYTKDGEFIKSYESYLDAEKQTGLHNGNIRLVCLGKRKSYGGYIWKLY